MKSRNYISRFILAYALLVLCLLTATETKAQQDYLDPSFGTGGKFTTDFGNSYDDISDIAVQSDGKIVSFGSASNSLIVTRHDANGTIDNTFGTNGIVRFGSDSYSSLLARKVVIQPDNKILISGIFDSALAIRLNSDGSFDTSFGVGGKLIVSGYSSADAMALQPDGKILIGSSKPYDTPPYTTDFALLRFNSNGTPDTDFGTNGVVTTDFNNGSDEYIESIVLQPDNKIVAAGYTYSSKDGNDFAAARYNSDGTLDTNFGTGGKVTADFNDSMSDDLYSAAIQADGKIILAGSTYNSVTGSDIALARYNSDGTLDTNFGNGGKVTNSFDSSSNISEIAQSVVVQPGGRIVVGVNSFGFTLVFYNGDGTLDTSLGTGGRIITNFGSSSYLYVLKAQPDGKLIAGGHTYVYSNDYDFALARYILPASYLISGRITVGSGAAAPPLANVAVSVTGTKSFTTTTDAFGNYSLTNLSPGNYTVTPQLANYTFTPTNVSFANLSTNQTANFTAVSGCAYSINPATDNVPSNASSGSFSVTTQQGCNWTAQSNADWITVTSGADGNTAGTVSYSVATNTGAARSGTITAAGQIFTVNQAGATTVPNSGLQYYPLAYPIRLLDTRSGQPTCYSSASFTGYETIKTQPAAVTCQGLTIPASAQAIVGTATALNTPEQGNLRLYPAGEPLAEVSNVNFIPGRTVSNSFTVKLGTNGAFNIYSYSPSDVIIDVTGYYAAPGVGGLYYHQLPNPIRILETRPGESGYQTPGAPLSANSVRLQQAGSISYLGVTIPASAKAVTGNATVVNHGFASAGSLKLYPGDINQVPVTENINYVANQTIPNAFTARLDASGRFNIYTNATTHVLIDITGYYSTEPTADQNGREGLLFNILPKPFRLLDTRAGFQACDAPAAKLSAQTVRVQTVRNRTCGNQTVPSTAKAIFGNATVVNNFSGAGFGNIRLYPGEQPLANASNLNYVSGDVMPNSFIVGLGASNGAMNIWSYSSTDVIVDVSGYFAP